MKKCPGCGRTYSDFMDRCPDCGSALGDGSKAQQACSAQAAEAPSSGRLQEQCIREQSTPVQSEQVRQSEQMQAASARDGQEKGTAGSTFAKILLGLTLMTAGASILYPCLFLGVNLLSVLEKAAIYACLFGGLMAVIIVIIRCINKNASRKKIYFLSAWFALIAGGMFSLYGVEAGRWAGIILGLLSLFGPLV